MKTRSTSAVAAILLCLVFFVSTRGEWPHWRGPQRNGHTPEASGWDGKAWKIEEVWSKKVGRGSSSPIVAGGKVYAVGWDQGKDTLFCLDLASGEAAWSIAYDAPRFGRESVGDQGLYDGPSSTPEFDSKTELLYTLGCDGELQCRDTAQRGKEVWRLNLYDVYAVPQRPQATTRRGTRRDYGYTTAPLVHGEWLLVEVGDDEGNVMAFDKQTGKRAWVSENKDPAGHTGGPAPITVEGVPCLCVLTMRNLVVLRLDKGHEGATVGEYPYVTDFANSVASPTVAGNQILITSKYNHHEMVRLEATLGGLREVWRKPFASGVCSPVVEGGKIYFVTNQFYCLDFETGNLVWQGGRFGDAGSIALTSDQRLIAWTGRGALVLVDTVKQSPTAYRELFRQGGPTREDVWPHLAVSGRSLLLRDREGNLVCHRLP